jgi:GTP cyclohydrolase IA
MKMGDAKKIMNTVTEENKLQRPTRTMAVQAVKTLLQWIGDNPCREGLTDTPERVIRAFDEYFSGYHSDPDALLHTTYKEVEGYDGMIVLTNIRLQSHCEHHMLPFIGTAHVGYIPTHKVVGISKLARIVDIYAKRLQIQEKLTAQIARCIERCLQPKGVAVVIKAHHQCMSMRGVQKTTSELVTSSMHGLFREDPRTRHEFMQLMNNDTQ